MKRFTIIMVLLSCMFGVNALNKYSLSRDDVRGLFWNEEKTAKIKVYRAKNGKYYGRIEALKVPNNKDGTPRLDVENPKKELRNREMLGLVIMKGFEWNIKENKWEDGTIYDPASGKIYDGYMYFENNNLNTLNLRGYVLGMTWLGRTSQWERIE